ncbi:P-loop containing nucleoside triphosphate hydrolase protein [Pelagophyceae sp. CCMP2097]|nr:P-loop containing nucleoside triphosphate hydrolase protein [Pelagophyceae sp. CCMP2097]|mmetsp:Transcript_6662/g.23816  ORF Transcript_6662/g.23816 Transcript_6662/m.23816 type:complete len:562 (-) Transcript_6662:38-1723(-)
MARPSAALGACALCLLASVHALVAPRGLAASRGLRLSAAPGGAGSTFVSQKSWVDVGASAELIAGAALCGAGAAPTKIQAMSYQALLAGKHVVLAEQTGSGKTLGYLLPLMQRLRDRERARGSTKEGRAQQQDDAAGCRPQVLVLAPTAELAQQVAGVCRALTKAAPLRVRCVTGDGGGDKRDAARFLKRSGCDILVATPGRLIEMVRTKAVELTDVSDVVLDEVDVLALDGDESLRPVFSSVSTTARFVFVTATLPQAVEQQLKKEFGDIKTCKGPGLHRVPPRLVVQLVDCSIRSYELDSRPVRRRPSAGDAAKKDDEDAWDGEDEEDEEEDDRRPQTNKRSFNGRVDWRLKRSEQRFSGTRRQQPRGEPAAAKAAPAALIFEKKKDALLQALRLGRPPTGVGLDAQAQRKLAVPKRTLVFCNTIESCRSVENALVRTDRKEEERTVLPYHSALPYDRREASYAQFIADGSDTPLTLVCTDRASRGVDFGALAVDHVVLFDWPRDPSEFLRRLGRTARAGRAGYATLLVAGKNLPLAHKIVEAANTGTPLDTVIVSPQD